MEKAAVSFVPTVAVRIAKKTWRLIRIMFNTYRPELHYMRGPGPKWREKHGQVPLQRRSRGPRPFPPQRRRLTPSQIA